MMKKLFALALSVMMLLSFAACAAKPAEEAPAAAAAASVDMSGVKLMQDGDLTVGMEIVWSKKRILTVYRNIAEFGDGRFGVEASAQRYFHKPASQLTPGEAALLAAVLPNPIRYRADAPSGYVRSRQAWILRQMRQLGGEGFMREHKLY